MRPTFPCPGCGKLFRCKQGVAAHRRFAHRPVEPAVTLTLERVDWETTLRVLDRSIQIMEANGTVPALIEQTREIAAAIRGRLQGPDDEEV